MTARPLHFFESLINRVVVFFVIRVFGHLIQQSATFETTGVRQNRHSYRSERVYPVWNNFDP